MNSWKAISVVFIILTIILGGVVAGIYAGAISVPSSSSTATTSGVPSTASASFIAGYLFDGEYAPMFVASDQGYWSQQGLAVSLIPGQGSSFAISEVAAGKVDFGIADVGAVMNAINKGTPIQCVAAFLYSPPYGVISWKNQSITSLAKMVGTTVIASPYDVGPKVFQAVMDDNNLNGSTLSVNPVTASDIVGAFLTQKSDTLSGWIDVEWVEANSVNNGQYNGSLSWLPMSNYVGNYFSECVFTSTSTISQRPTVVKEMVTGWDKALQFAANNANQTANIFVKYNPTATFSDIFTKVKLTTGLWSPPSGTAFGTIPPTAVKNTFNVYKLVYKLPASFNINGTFTNQFTSG